MSLDPRHDDLDDELLSAYLDDELAPEERAAVEARLAADPAAQHLLHELRSVSQDVQALPTESLGRDLSEVILRRAVQTTGASRAPSESKTAAAEERPAGSGGELPKLTIFGSPRAWFWASLALAAGLMIMFISSGGEKLNEGLQPIAQRDREIAADSPAENSTRAPARRALSEPGLSAVPASAPPASAVAADKHAVGRSAVAAPQMPAQVLADSADDAKKNAPAALPSGPPAGQSLAAASPAREKDEVAPNVNGGPSNTAALAAQSSSGSLAAPPQAVGRASGAGGALGGRFGGQEPKPAELESPVVVVHVLATPDAIQNKAFDQLLASHDISIESQTANDRSYALGDSHLAKQAEKEFGAGNSSGNAPAAESADFLFVEAPRSAIISCLHDLKQDAKNYAGIKVDERLAANNRGPASEERKKAADALSQYDRGSFSQSLTDSSDRFDSSAYYGVDFRGGAAPAASPRPNDMNISNLEVRVEQDRYGVDGSNPKPQQTQKLGRAIRFQPQDALKLQTASDGKPRGRAELAPAAAKSSNVEQLQQNYKRAAEAANENLRVLFVITPNQPPQPASPPAKLTK